MGAWPPYQQILLQEPGEHWVALFLENDGRRFSMSCVETCTNWIMHVERSETRLVYEAQAGEEHGEADLVGDLPEFGASRALPDSSRISIRPRGDAAEASAEVANSRCNMISSADCDNRADGDETTLDLF